MHLCPVEIVAVFSSLPVFKWLVPLCCRKVLEKWHKHYKGHKKEKRQTVPFEYIGDHVIRVKKTDADRPNFISAPPPPPGGYK